jgi:hypothetical protein
MDAPLKKKAYQWKIALSHGDEIVLSEQQYKAFVEHLDDSMVFLDGVQINPRFVVSAIKEEALELKKKYPCRQCLTYGGSGGTVCTNCEGTGLDFNHG